MNRRLSRAHFVSTGVALGIPVAARAAETYTLRMSLAQSMNTAQGASAVLFARAVNRRTKGQVKIEIYPSMQLASEGASLDGLSTGTLDFVVTSSAVLQTALPQFQVFDLPFMFKDLNAAFKVLDGPIGNEFASLMETKGVLGLGWATGGFREIETTSKAIVVPDDMKGLRMRVQPGAVYVATYRALGAIPVTVDMSEAFIALQQKTVDGIDINLNGIAREKFYTVIKHVAMANHILSLLPLMGSKRKIEALPAPVQKIIKEEAKASIAPWRAEVIRQLSEDIATLKSNGVAFTEPQFPAFKKAMEPVYAMFQSKLGADVIDRVSRASNAA